MADITGRAISVALALFIISIILPLGLSYVSGIGSTYVVVGSTNQTVAQWVDPSVITLLTILLPVMAVIGILLYFVPKMNTA